MRARDNPFRAERLHALRYRFPVGGDHAELLARLEALDYRAAIVGPEGHGKTTLQEELAVDLARRGLCVRWLRLRRDDRKRSYALVRRLLADLCHEDLVFVDGAEQLPWLTWRRLVRRTAACRGLLITTHQPGRLPTLLECRTSPDLLREIAAELAPDDVASLEPKLDELFARHAGNLRLCLRELYDWFAMRDTHGCVDTMARLRGSPGGSTGEPA